MPEDSIPKKQNAIKPLPSVERLRELLAYDPETGVFRWKVRRQVADAGSMDNGYRRIRIDGVLHMAHRVAWKIMTGDDPIVTIDHINNQPADNRFANLREATRREQCINVTAWGSSEFLGVSWKKCRRKWQVHIKVNGKSRNLGTFACEIEAARAYDAAAIEHHGEFANLNFPEAAS